MEDAVLRHSGVEPISKPRLSLPSTHPVLITLLGCTGYYVGAIIGFALTFPTDAVSTLWPDAHWEYSLVLDPNQRTENYDQLDERASWFYEAIAASYAMITATPGGDKTFKVHLDGYNITDALAGKTPSPRKEFFYFNDDGSLVALRYNQWKLVFAEQRAHGFDVWQEPFVTLRIPRLYNIRSNPFETAEHSMDYWRWRAERLFLLVPAQQYVGQFLATFKEFPPSQKVGSFSLDQVLQTLQRGSGNK